MTAARRGYFVAQCDKGLDSLRWEVACNGARLHPAPPFSTGENRLLPVRVTVEPAIGNEELKYVLQARAEACATYRYVKRTDIMGLRVPGLREKVRQCTAVRVNLHVGSRRSRRFTEVIEPDHGGPVQ